MIYRKIFIKSKDDLPKDGRFIVHMEEGVCSYPMNHSKGKNIEYWIKNFDWYLLPEEEPTDEEIKEWIIDKTMQQYGIGVKGFYVEQRIWGAKAMRDNPKAFKK